MKKVIEKFILIALISMLSCPQVFAAQNPYLGQIMIVGFNFCPRGWSRLDGQTLPISSYSALFSLLGTTYGGDGGTTLGIPAHRGRSPVHAGSGPGLPTITRGEKSGSTLFTINANNLPSHNHAYSITTKEGRGVTDNGSFLAQSGIYRENGTTKLITGGTTNNTGSGQAVSHRSPFLGLYFCMATDAGVFPSR